MILEIPAPGGVDGFVDLETLARYKADEITEALNVETQTNDGVVGNNFVPNQMSQRYLESAGYIYSHIYSGDAQPLSAPFVERSMRLGLVVAHELLAPQPFAPSASALRAHTHTDSRDFYEYVMDSSYDFLMGGRDTLTGILAVYTAEFTHTTEDQFRAMAMGGLTLLHIEQRRYNHFCNRQAAAFKKQLEHFRGDISELE